MNRTLLALGLLALLAPLTACTGKLSEADVRQFIDKADDAARKRYGPEICALRGESFTLERTVELLDQPVSEPMEIGRKLFCREAGSFSRIRQYKLERTSLEVALAPDRKTARVVAEYVETLPYYEMGMMPATPDDFREFQVIESRDESVVGIERGDPVFLSSNVVSVQTELIHKSKLHLPYD